MNQEKIKRVQITAAVFLGVSLAVLPASAQVRPASPLSNVVVAGYGTTSYTAMNGDELVNNFTASVSPVILYSMGNDLLFETELEFGLSGQVTTTSLEYAQIDYLGFERVQIIAGKFLLPFGVFSERLHPTWINKMPSSPPVYGHAHGGVVEGALLPVLSDAGVLVRLNQPLNSDWTLDVSAWVSQGPRLVTEEDAAGEHVDEHESAGKMGESSSASSAEVLDVPLVGFGIAFNDNNENKMLGGRIGLVHGPDFEIYASGFHAMYDPENFLDIYGANVAIEYRTGPIELRGEGVLVRQELEIEDGFEFLNAKGYYLQAARRFSDFEAVVRWGHLLDSKVMGELVRSEKRLLALGLNYWIDASIPIKVAYEIDFDGIDRIMLQWAFGF